MCDPSSGVNIDDDDDDDDDVTVTRYVTRVFYEFVSILALLLCCRVNQIVIYNIVFSYVCLVLTYLLADLITNFIHLKGPVMWI